MQWKTYYDTKLQSQKRTNLIGEKNMTENKIATKAVRLIEKTIRENGYRIDQIHLLNYTKYNALREKMKRTLRDNNVDLSFKTGISKIHNIEVCGNADGILTDYYFHYIKKHWEEQVMDKATLECFLKKHPKSKIYMEDKFGHVDETTKEELMETTFGKTFTTMGIGSCASTIEESVKLYKDKRNNLKISRFCMKWD